MPKAITAKFAIIVSSACLFASTSLAAYAQAPNGSRMEKARAELQKRFEAADTNHDGKLTPDEAKAGMPLVAKNFDAIDTAHAGSISISDIEAFIQSRKGSRKAQN